MNRESKVSNGFSLSILQARLDISISVIGSMSPQVVIYYSNRKFSTKIATATDRLPIWQETFNFEFTSQDLELIVYHKPLLLKDQEIGRCTVKVQDASGRFELKKDQKKVGALRISIREDRETQLSTLHSSKESYDIRDDCLRKMNELELEKEEALFYKRKFKSKLKKLREKRKSCGNAALSSDFSEVTNFESADSNSEEFVMRIQCQVNDLQQTIQELIKRKELLETQEENLGIEKVRIAQEWEEICKERKEFASVKRKISEEFSKLRGEQERVQSCSKVAESFNRAKKCEYFRAAQASRVSGMLSPVLRSKKNIQSPVILCLSTEDLQEKVEVNKVPMTVEKSRPPLHPLSGNSSRLITFE